MFDRHGVAKAKNAMKQADIITIGDELLIGQVVDTNSAFMAQRLNEWGICVRQITSVHDDADHIREALTDSLRKADIVFLTGGLGPTKDDITKHVLADYFSTHLIYSTHIRAHLERLYAERPAVLNRLTDSQCMVPEACTILENAVGSAQVMLFCRENKHVFSLPGVPREMEWCMTHSISDYIHQHGLLSPADRIVHRNLRVNRVPESSLAIMIEAWEEALPATMHLAYLPKRGEDGRYYVLLRLSGYGVEAAPVETELRRCAAIVEAAIAAAPELYAEASLSFLDF